MRQRRHPERLQDANARAPARRLFRRWLRDRRASVLPVVALCGLVLVGVTGLALDGARMAIMSSRLQASVDAAGLSAGARVSTEAFEAEVDRFTRANFDDGYVGAAITAIDARPGSDDETFIVSASAQASTIFMRIFGIDDFDVSAEAEITRAMGGLELALVLDVTGSMEGSKLTSLKTASKDLLNILFADDNAVDQLHVGIVPFAHAVNIGKSRSSWLTTENNPTLTRSQKDYYINRWGGCVEERFDGHDRTDLPAKGSDPFNDDPKSQYFRPILETSRCPAEVTSMTSTKSTLVSAIDRLKADGGTHVNVGAVWGWRMLSPQWRGLWGSGTASSLPLDYNAGASSKAAVIMTDGKNEFSTGWSYGNPTGYYCKRYNRRNECTEYGVTFDSRMGSASNAAEANSELDTKLEAICINMKNAGVTIYTVVFGSIGASAEKRLKDCASQPAFYFYSPDGAALQTAFAKIGDSLSNLRVSR